MTDATTYDRQLRVEPALSWSGIIAGSLVAVASSVFLTTLASGFGYDVAAGALASRRSLDAFTPELGAAAIAIQVISAGLGGYLAGRLRHVWALAHADEAHFRDTAQGLIVWALSTVVGLTLIAAVVTPYSASLAPPTAGGPAIVDASRAMHIASQSAFFTAVGMLLSAFIAAVASRIGGLQAEHMHQKGR